MILHTRFYLLFFLGLSPLLLIGVFELIYSFFYPFKFPFAHLEPVILSLVIMYDIILAVIFFFDLVLSLRSDELTVNREISEKLSINRLNKVILRFSNFSSQELIAVAKDDMPEMLAFNENSHVFEKIKIKLPPFSKGEFTYFVKPNYRGEYEFGSIHVRFISKFKLFWKQIKIAKHQKIKVYPDLMSLNDLSIKLSKSLISGETRIKKLGQGTDFSSLREYMIGDDIRKIDWHATSRRDYPIVKTFEITRDQDILILLDAGRMMSTNLSGLSRFDWGINAALSLSLAALTRGDHVGLGIFAGTSKLFIPPKGGKSHLKNIIEGVNNIYPEPHEPDYIGVLAKFASMQKKRALVVIITDLVDAIASKMLLSGLAHLAPRHIPLCVSFNDKTLISLSKEDVSTVDDVYLQSVSIDLLENRKQALNVLVRKGGLFIDVPPEDLSNAIVEKYLDIKSKNLI